MCLLMWFEFSRLNLESGGYVGTHGKVKPVTLVCGRLVEEERKTVFSSRTCPRFLVGFTPSARTSWS